MVLIYVLPTIIIVLIIYYLDGKKNYGNLPGPWAFPIIGNAHQFIWNVKNFLFVIDGYMKMYGSRFRFYIGRELIVSLTDPKDVEILLSSNTMIAKSSEYDTLKPWLGNGLLTSNGEKWRKHRKAITPTFHFKILEQFIQIFEVQTNTLIEKLEKHADRDFFDVVPYVKLCALDIICEAAMGVSINAQCDTESDFVNAVKDNCRIVISRVLNPFKRLNVTFRMTSDYWKQRVNLKILHDYTDKMIDERRKILNQTDDNLNIDCTIPLGIKKKLAFLDMLLLSTIDGNPLDDLSIREEVDTFLFEGHETITSSITFILYLLSKHRNVQNKLYEEQNDIFKDNLRRPVTLRDLNDMKYMEMVIKESLRLYPPVAMIGRLIEQDTNINDLPLKADTAVMVPIYSMNRNPEIFPKPEEFMPERFSPDEITNRNPFSSVYFSAGPRNCIGKKFAMLEIKSTISKLIRNYEILNSGKEIKLTFDLMLRSRNGINIKIKKRTMN